MSEKYFAVQFWSGRNETTGDVNKETGLMNIACDIEVFSSKDKRDEYVLEGDENIANLDFDGNCREVVTENQARQLCLGMSDDEFEAHINGALDNEITQVSNAAMQNVRAADQILERYKKLGGS